MGDTVLNVPLENVTKDWKEGLLMKKICFTAKTKAGEKSSTFGMIKNIEGENVLIDLNHPLAGQSILLKVKILKVK